MKCVILGVSNIFDILIVQADIKLGKDSISNFDRDFLVGDDEIRFAPEKIGPKE